LTEVLKQRQVEGPEVNIVKATEVITVFDPLLKQIKGLPNASLE